MNEGIVNALNGEWHNMLTLLQTSVAVMYMYTYGKESIKSSERDNAVCTSVAYVT